MDFVAGDFSLRLPGEKVEDQMIDNNGACLPSHFGGTEALQYQERLRWLRKRLKATCLKEKSRMSKNHLPHDSYNRDAYLSSFRRTPLRLPNRDYSTGVYHIVACAQGIGGRKHLFLHPILRQLLQTNWLDLPLRFPASM